MPFLGGEFHYSFHLLEGGLLKSQKESEEPLIDYVE